MYWKTNLKKKTETYSYNASNKLVKIQSFDKGKPLNVLFKYDATGKLSSANVVGKMDLKVAYNAENVLASTTAIIEKSLTIINDYEYADGKIVKITTSMGMMGASSEKAVETTLSYEKDNITKIVVHDILRDSTQTVISDVSYDDINQLSGKEETLLIMGLYAGYEAQENLLNLSKNNPLKISLLKFGSTEPCEANPISIAFDYQYNASKRVTQVIRKETCGEETKTETHKIESTCK